MKVLNDKELAIWRKKPKDEAIYSEEWVVKFWILNSNTLFWNQLEQTYHTEDKDMYDEVKEKWEQDTKNKTVEFVSIKYQ